MLFARRGQGMLEYSIMVIVIIAALMVMQVYVKRGMQGRWKAAVDDVGEQFDVQKMRGTVVYSLDQNSSTNTTVEDTTDGLFTLRKDSDTTTETTTGTTTINSMSYVP